jgi:hypothetical protein
LNCVDSTGQYAVVEVVETNCFALDLKIIEGGLGRDSVY